MTSNDNPNHHLARTYEEAMLFILKQGINSLPVDPFELCEKNGWKTISVKEFCKKHDYDEEFMLSNVIMSDYGAAIHFKQYGYFCIVYNDAHDDEVVRWTITHEIGHIVLGHFDSTANIIMKGTLSPDEYTRCEVESEWFARAVLAPPPVLNAINRKKSTQIEQLCGLSRERAGMSALFLRGPWVMMEKDADMEKRILRQFHQYIKANRNS